MQDKHMTGNIVHVAHGLSQLLHWFGVEDLSG